MTVRNEKRWTDAAGTHHIVTLEKHGHGYIVRHVLNLRAGASVAGDQGYERLRAARAAFVAESKASER